MTWEILERKHEWRLKMLNVLEFIKWGLKHCKRSTVPTGAILPIPADEVGSLGEWRYLMGCNGYRVNQHRIDRAWNIFYSSNGWTRAEYDRVTDAWNWRTKEVYACDCGGLLDAYMTQVIGEQTDFNVPMLIDRWCTNYVAADPSKMPVGKVIFVVGSNGRANHVGWIAGHMPDGEPVIMESRGLAYGLRLYKWSQRNFRRMADMSKKFYYPEAGEEQESEDMARIFVYNGTIWSGEDAFAMQTALREAGYTDYEDKPLEPNGKWGRRSQSAFDKMMAAHTTGTTELPEEMTVTAKIDDKTFTGVIKR